MTERELLVRIDERVEKLEKALLGNGQPGAIAIQGGRIAALERWRARVTGGVKTALWIAAPVVSLAGALIVAALKR